MSLLKRTTDLLCHRIDREDICYDGPLPANRMNDAIPLQSFIVHATLCDLVDIGSPLSMQSLVVMMIDLETIGRIRH